MVTGAGFVPTWELRARFAADLSALYGAEVPAYLSLVRACEDINRAVLGTLGPEAERLGSTARVTAERHGAIRVGSPAELAQTARIFGAVGMYPVGFYDLRDAPSPVPVVSTAFRPIDADELERNPFRVFTSVLATEDARFFDRALRSDLQGFLARRELFRPELLALADRARAGRGLAEADARAFLQLATEAFALSGAPVDRAWYERLAKVSAVAADIGGVGSTHINHLTPRVLDIDALYAAMIARGVEMIDEIQGPPRWDGPPVLLRQTSFRALAEPRRFTEADGTITSGSLRVRFGEVEARGLALTPTGRDRYDGLIQLSDASRAGSGPHRGVPPTPREVFGQGLPSSERDFAVQDLAFFTYSSITTPARDGRTAPVALSTLIDDGWVQATPIVYEDFLPRSAAGIFASNLEAAGSLDRSEQAARYDADWLAGALESELLDPMALYDEQQRRSLDAVAVDLDIEAVSR